jgi:hypothetical protein
MKITANKACLKKICNSNGVIIVSKSLENVLKCKYMETDITNKDHIHCEPKRILH